MENFVTLLLGNEAFIGAMVAVFGTLLTIIINRAAGAFTAATGIQIEAKHREALHEAIKTGVESALRHGPVEAGATMKAHVVQHLRESVPEALTALTPGDGPLDRLIERYTHEALARFGGPK